MKPTTKTYNFYLHPYRLLPYEIHLARKEIHSIFPDCSDIQLSGKLFSLQSAATIAKETIENLTYFHYVEILCCNGIETIETIQARIERDVHQANKQNTKYSAHGLHEYKGKFNPQIARWIINYQPNGYIVDPFCGSGTTLLESMHAGIPAIGIDANPLAAYVSEAKILSLTMNATKLQKKLLTIANDVHKIKKPVSDDREADDIQYLRDWIPIRTLEYLENVRYCASQHKGIGNILLALASSILRDYSNQEPMDLRIRRRFSPFPQKSIAQALEEQINTFTHKLAHTQNIIGILPSTSKAYYGDNRCPSIYSETLAAKQAITFVTSPPYATALPYIDTSRISIVWLKLGNKKQLKSLENGLIGTRELSKKIITELKAHFPYDSNLPESVISLCRQLNENLTEKDGFRRQALPSLVYKYFSDIHAMFSNAYNYSDSNSFFFLVVGANSTILSGNRIEINTPELLLETAEKSGWRADSILPLDTYHRYSMHSRNSIRTEKLLVLKHV